MKAVLSVFILFVFGLTASAQTVPDELALLRAKFEKKADEGGGNEQIEKLNQSYVGALTRLSGEIAKTGELDRVVAVKKEIEEFGGGANFSKEAFEKRISAIPQLKSLQETYLRTRVKYDSQQSVVWGKLVAIYVKELAALVKSLTKEQRINDAILVKKERERIMAAGGMAQSSKRGAFKAEAHFIAKTELEVYINGEKIRYRNDSKDPQYVDAESKPLDIAVGDIIALRVRGNASFRAVIFGMAAVEGKKHIQFPASVHRLISTDERFDPKTVDAKVMEENAGAVVRMVSGDQVMQSHWAEHGIGNCEFVRPPVKGGWAVFGIVITEEMIVEP